MSDEGLAAFAPVPRTVQVAGATLQITPFRVGQVPAVLAAVRAIEPAMRVAPVDWLAIVAEHGHTLIGLVAMAAARPREWVEALPLDEFGVLAQAVWEVNLDFFARRLAPLLNPGAASRSTGPAPSASSSVPATN